MGRGERRKREGEGEACGVRCVCDAMMCASREDDGTSEGDVRQRTLRRSWWRGSDPQNDVVDSEAVTE